MRQRLLERAEQEGTHALHERLAEADPVTASRLHPNDVRRVSKLAEAPKAATSWPADLALVDGTMLAGAEKITLGVPALVLSGNEEDAIQRLRSLDNGRGWVRKDSQPGDLVAAIERAVRGGVVTGSQRAAGSLALLVFGLLLLGVVGLLLYVAWIAIV